MTIKKRFVPIVITLALNVILRCIYIFYGYIATEEGTLILNQAFAYKGNIPFVDYNAWNSFLHDYLLGWTQFFLPPSILMQRFVGLFLAIAIIILTIRLAALFNKRTSPLLTVLLMTFGSPFYLYIGTIPYSEQTMSFFLLASLIFFIQGREIRNTSYRNQLLALLSLVVSVFIRVQALPMAFFIWFALLWSHKHNLVMFIKLTIIAVFFAFLLSFPFLKNPGNFFYGFAWPLMADKILLYQKDVKILPSFIPFTLQLLRDYGLFAIYIFSGFFFLRRDKDSKVSLNLFLLICGAFFLTALLHKPPYVSYLYPAVPIFSILASYYLSTFMDLLQTRNLRRFIYSVILLLLGFNFVRFPHDQYIKTSFSDLTKTPHTYLAEITALIKKTSQPNDELLTFYGPLASESHLPIPPNFNRDRFSISLLSSEDAIKYHLLNVNMLKEYISSKKAGVIAFTEKNLRLFGENPADQKQVLDLINTYYDRIGDFETISLIEDPKTRHLYIYRRKF